MDTWGLPVTLLSSVMTWLCLKSCPVLLIVFLFRSLFLARIGGYNPIKIPASKAGELQV
jgi:hypothetical protein